MTAPQYPNGLYMEIFAHKIEGVVGQRPVIAPGQVFRYSSWCVLPTPSGWMRGTYSMVATGGGAMVVPIPTFSLATPHALN